MTRGGTIQTQKQKKTVTNYNKITNNPATDLQITTTKLNTHLIKTVAINKLITNNNIETYNTIKNLTTNINIIKKVIRKQFIKRTVRDWLSPLIK